MTARQPDISDPFIRFHASGWIISIGLHGSAILLAGFFVAKIGLAPPSSSFQWDVTVVGSQPPTPAQVAPGAPPPAAAIVRPAQRNVAATALRPTPSPAALPTMPASTSNSPATVERDTIKPVLPNLRQRRMTVNLPCTRHRHRSRPPLTPAHCPRWQILRLQTHLSPRKCQKRHRNRPLSPPPLQPKRHRSPHRPTRLRLPENRTMAGSQGLCSSGLKHSNNIPPRRGCIAWKVG